jgi:hypothetical protein
MFRRIVVSAVVVVACAQAWPLAQSDGYRVARTGIFAPQNKKVLLLQDAAGQKPVILFQTRLRVNTDGSPLSYHPDDLRGRDKALNNICNAIAVRKVGSDANLCLTAFAQGIRVFEQFRDASYKAVPDGFQITWANVLATKKDQGRDMPCVFSSGPFQGYFGSLTALKNGLTGDKGECDVNDQVNPMDVPGLVLVGGTSAVREFGARVGDLLVAFNPATMRVSSAIINDTGPRDNLGEGSVRLNMNLLGVTMPPRSKAETFKLSIETTQVLVAIIPGSRTFQVARPYTATNLDARVKVWQTQAGFTQPEQFVDMIKSFASSLQ